MRALALATKKPKPSGGPTCPICRVPVRADDAHFPFCGDRCKTIDLAKWAQGDYVISRSIEQADLDET